MNKNKKYVIGIILLLQTGLFASCVKTATAKYKPVVENASENTIPAITIQHGDTDNGSRLNNNTENEPVSDNPHFERNVVCTSIYELYSTLNLKGNISAFENALLSFFKTEESLTLDISKELPFIYSTVSDDGLLRVYCYDHEYEYGWSKYPCFTSIIQYRMTSGKLNAIFLEDFGHTPVHDNKYDTIVRLDEHTYLLQGIQQANAHEELIGFIALTLRDDTVVPYLAFNNDMYLGFFNLYDGLGQIYEEYDVAEYSAGFKDTEFTITLDYVTKVLGKRVEKFDQDIIEANTLEFIFNGQEFIGDYETMKKITPWW